MSIEKVSWEVFALFGLKGTETISNALIFVYDLWNNDFEEEQNSTDDLKSQTTNHFHKKK